MQYLKMTEHQNTRGVNARHEIDGPSTTRGKNVRHEIDGPSKYRGAGVKMIDMKLKDRIATHEM